MKKIISIILFLTSAVCFSENLKNFIVFGDSLSDNGNLYEYMQHQLPMSPPYFHGRFSDRPVWIEQLAKMYYPSNTSQHLLDYAFGGAGVSEDPEMELLFTLKHEIDGYLLSHQDKADPDSLYVVWIGANNYLALSESDDHSVDETILGIRHSLETLVHAGARHFLILNLPDLGIVPYARSFGLEEVLTNFAVEHNQKLAVVVDILQHTYPQTKWYSYDVYSKLSDAVQNPAKYGFNNVQDVCYESLMPKSLLPKATQGYAMLNVASHVRSKGLSGSQCDGFLFFDMVHPTGMAHAIISSDIKKMLDAKGVQFVD